MSAHPRGVAVGFDPLLERVRRFIQRERGGGYAVAHFDVMEDGHAGLTYGFDLCDAKGEAAGRYVLKLAPAGVARRGNTDVYRQAPLLRALKGAGVPVPDVPWASPDEEALGVPFIIMERLPGRVFMSWQPHESFPRDPVRLRDIWLQAANLLAKVHRVDWRRHLAGWEEPRPLSLELDRWTTVLRHAQEPEWHIAGTSLGSALAACMPDGDPVGLVHGDFQPGNILYENERANAVIDWELASIGAQGLDVGWLLMMLDPLAWHPDWRPVAPVGKEELLAAYRRAGGPDEARLEWYQALAQYRLGSIACLNVKLHRTGKRTDPIWERFALSIPSLFARGLDLVTLANSS
ncbi:phosphotransferase family protein [Bradyrhizobium sp. INPA01-394B]|uniref:Phosphotransferase family protein n=1 Tax=Bradyrhizobium campsiandrae TaxID=1729892 RepID=A0ABR7UKG3_9BRAD|nr:phosphotransferase family protein [Bradyrhizobium campsiandrae]MBC9882159.1 phosphotransferase family protein [Bradyrhizobium campsiandrae]MBC9984352.1 phosphotransferase family protein [Bradyrhizobium campsiandrae]